MWRKVLHWNTRARTYALSHITHARTHTHTDSGRCVTLNFYFVSFLQYIFFMDAVLVSTIHDEVDVGNVSPDGVCWCLLSCFFGKLVLINQTEGSTIPACPSFICCCTQGQYREYYFWKYVVCLLLLRMLSFAYLCLLFDLCQVWTSETPWGDHVRLTCWTISLQ